MNVEFTARKYKITPTIRREVETGLDKIRKILGDRFETKVILAVEKRRHKAEITIDPPNGLIVGLAETTDMASAVNEALDVHIPADMMDRRLAGAAAATDHKMSMLQDLERGRSLEIDALVDVVQELGRLTSVPTPLIDAVLALIKERGRASGLYSELATLTKG